jgi:hypothetical protein
MAEIAELRSNRPQLWKSPTRSLPIAPPVYTGPVYPSPDLVPVPEPEPTVVDADAGSGTPPNALIMIALRPPVLARTLPLLPACVGLTYGLLTLYVLSPKTMAVADGSSEILVPEIMITGPPGTSVLPSTRYDEELSTCIV